MNRGRRREKIFLSHNDHEAFLKVLQETTEGWNLRISAYCLMPNHYHLLVQTPKGNLSRCMRHINGVYTQRFNRRHKTDGPLFRGRYKAVLISADSYLLEVLRYIHRNPLRAGLAKALEDFAWSSHPGYLSKAKKWEWLHKNFILSMFSAKKSGGNRGYLDFVTKAEPEEIERFYSLKKLPSLLGGDAFREWVQQSFQDLRFPGEIPESRILVPSPEEMIDRVCSHFKVNREKIFTSRRGTENVPRDVAIYLARRHCRETLATIGRYFGIAKYSTVSSAVERVRTKKDQDRSLRKLLEKIEKELYKGQRQT